MGQYYKACLISETEVKIIRPDWSKLMEHSYYGNLSMDRVEKILSEWSKRVIWMWDYAECAPFVWHYHWDEEDWRCSDRDHCKKDLILEKEGWVNYYLINYSKHEFINMGKQKANKKLQDEFGWVVHPLPLLCRATTEEAWWDYHSEINRDYIWRWCWDKIYIMISKVELDDALIKEQSIEDMTNILFFKE